MFLCTLSMFVGYGDRIVNLTMGWFAIKLYQADSYEKKYSTARREVRYRGPIKLQKCLVQRGVALEGTKDRGRRKEA